LVLAVLVVVVLIVAIVALIGAVLIIGLGHDGGAVQQRQCQYGG
jgi:hypothetical protein